VKTTVELPDLLFKRVKARAVIEGVKLKDYIARALQRSIDGGSGRGARIEKPPVVLRGRRKSIPARSNAEIEELLIKESLR